MNRAEKIAAVEELKQSFTTIPHMVLATFRGLNVNQATELRSRVRKAGGQMQVVKNRLAKRATTGTPAEPLVEHFSGPCALVTHPEDPVALAKTLAEFSKENPQLGLLAGIIEAHELLDAAGLKELSRLPGLPELRAQLLALVQTPATMLVRLLGTPGTQLARVLDAKSETQD